MENIMITVYRDTVMRVSDYDFTDNMLDIEVTKEFAEQYYNEKKSKYKYWNSFDEFLEDYTCDTTEDFYEYAKEHDAIINTIEIQEAIMENKIKKLEIALYNAVACFMDETYEQYDDISEWLAMLENELGFSMEELEELCGIKLMI